jgi:hypothetical protein
MMAAVKLTDLAVGDILSWNDVSDVHKIRNGIYQRNGKLISLLTDFGRINPCYPDHDGDEAGTIHYHGYGRHGNQKLDAPNRALFDAITSAHSVPLFNKLSVGRWQFVGLVRVLNGEYIFDERQQRMVWQFTLSVGTRTPSSAIPLAASGDL